MMSLLSFRCVLIGLGMLVLLGGTGCATSADLRRLNAELTQNQDANAEVLRAELNAAQAAQAQQLEEMRRVLESVRAEMATANILTEYMAKTMDGINKMTLWAKNMNKQFANIKQVPALLSGLSMEMHSLRLTLLESYRLEEAALKDRLRTMEQSLRQLEALPGGNHVNRPGGVAATRPHKASDGVSR